MLQMTTRPEQAVMQDITRWHLKHKQHRKDRDRRYVRLPLLTTFDLIVALTLDLFTPFSELWSHQWRI